MGKKERRKHPRRHFNIPAELRVNNILYPCRIRNISEGGFFVETEVFFSVEEEGLLTAPDFKMAEKPGITLRLDASGIGGKFEEEEGTIKADRQH